MSVAAASGLAGSETMFFSVKSLTTNFRFSRRLNRGVVKRSREILDGNLLTLHGIVGVDAGCVVGVLGVPVACSMPATRKAPAAVRSPWKAPF